MRRLFTDHYRRNRGSPCPSEGGVARRSHLYAPCTLRGSLPRRERRPVGRLPALASRRGLVVVGTGGPVPRPAGRQHVNVFLRRNQTTAGDNTWSASYLLDAWRSSRNNGCCLFYSHG